MTIEPYFLKQLISLILDVSEIGVGEIGKNSYVDEQVSFCRI